MPCRPSCVFYSTDEGKCFAEDDELPEECEELFSEGRETLPDGDCSSCAWSTEEGCVFGAPCPGIEVRQ